MAPPDQRGLVDSCDLLLNLGDRLGRPGDPSPYLGHSDPGFTLRAYSHLMPSSEQRTRRAIDRALGDDPAAGDGLRP